MPSPYISDPVARSILRPAVIRPYSYAPEPLASVQYAIDRRPAPVLRGQPGEVETFRLPLGDGEDAPQILAYLHALSVQFAQAPFMREFTVNTVLRGTGVLDNEQDKQILAVLDFVRRNVTYVRDPVDSEYVISPINLIEQIQNGQKPYGDCEDHVLLLNSMLGSIGFPTRFVSVKINGGQWFNHVVSAVYAHGEWRDLDPCAKGMEQPEFYEKLISATNYGQ